MLKDQGFKEATYCVVSIGECNLTIPNSLVFVDRVKDLSYHPPCIDDVVQNQTNHHDTDIGMTSSEDLDAIIDAFDLHEIYGEPKNQVDDIEDKQGEEVDEGVGEGVVNESMDAVQNEKLDDGGIRLEKPEMAPSRRFHNHILQSELLRFCTLDRWE